MHGAKVKHNTVTVTAVCLSVLPTLVAIECLKYFGRFPSL
jgi:hypothetical protein